MSSHAPALPRALRVRPRALRLHRHQVALGAILVAAAALVLVDLSASGMSNEYYAAAVKSASESWKALFFGSLDPGSFITVDKPPLSIWLMGLSVRVFGFSSFAMLLPEALCTVAAVALLFTTVKRFLGPGAGLLAAGALALTPVAVAVGRVNNPDALLVLLLVAAAWAVGKAVESGRTRHLLWAGAFVGLAFMTKMLAGWMTVPALALAYLVAGPPALGKRVLQLLGAGVAMVAVSAAWPLAVSLWPGSAPYIGGSTDGSAWDLILGYNGLGRIFGEGGGGMGGGGMSFGGEAGLWRLFNTQTGAQASWLLPLALVGLLAGLWLSRRAPRTDPARAGWLLFGGWAATLAVVFSFQEGIFHAYYVSALAPAVAALAGAGLVTLTRWARASWAGVVALDVAVLATAGVAVMFLKRSPDFQPWLQVAVPVLAGLVVLGSVWLRDGGLAGRRATVAVLVAATLAVSVAPAAYSVATAGRSLNGNNVTAGPASSASGGMGMGGGPGGGTSSRGGGGGGGMGGGVSDETIAWLQAHQGSAKYLLAASGSQTTASVIVSTGEAVVTMGGFSGSDNAPTVSQLEALVSSGQLKYVLISGQGGGPGGGNQAVTQWVTEHGTKVTDAGVTSGTLYAVSA